MKSVSGDDVQIGLTTHFQALERLWLLYRMPSQFFEWQATQRLTRQIKTQVLLGLHALPHILWVCVLSRWICHETTDVVDVWADVVSGIGLGAAVVCVLSLFVVASTLNLNFKGDLESPRDEIAQVIGLSLTIGSGFSLIGAFVTGLTGDLYFAIAIIGGICIGALAEVKGREVSVALLAGLLTILAIRTSDLHMLAAIIAATRIYYLPVQVLLIWPKILGSLYPCHPIAWDEMYPFPAPRLGLLLADYARTARAAADREIDRLLEDHSSQLNQALVARSILIARDSAEVKRLTELPGVLERLWSRDVDQRTYWFWDTVSYDQKERLEKAVRKVVQAQKECENYRAMPIFFVQRAKLVRGEVLNLRESIAELGLHKHLASEFDIASSKWLKLAELQIEDAAARAAREPVPQVFQFDKPVDSAGSEAFVPRRDVTDEMAAHVAAANCPGLLLYARRRMGKSSCLRNLTDFLPSRIGVVHLNLQDPGISGSEELFCSRLAAAIDSDQADGDSGPATLVELGMVLSTLNERLGDEGRRLLIGLDEYEYLDAMLAERALPQGLTAVFRTSIQEHRNLIWVFAGSHQIRELKNAQWPSALISVRTIEIDRFTPQEAETLLTHPLEHSKLWPAGSPDRPAFDPEFWGPDGIQRLRDMADGWPHLFILLAEICVNLVNQRNAEYVTDELFEAAVQKAVVQGDNVMIQLLQNESELPGEWDFLLGFKTRKTQPLPEDAAIVSSLQRRSLILVEDDQVRLRVPLMQLWMETRA